MVVKDIEVVPPLQIVCMSGTAVTFGAGCTVTSKLNGVPSQAGAPGPVGVIMYRTTPVEVPVFTKLAVIRVPDPGDEIPVIVPPAGEVNMDAVQAKVVPEVAETGV